MIAYLAGILTGFTVGYPLGLWAIKYTIKEGNKRG